jgi:putative ABC transport system permease protein
MKTAFATSILFALRNVFRQRARTFATLTSIALGVGGLIIVGGFVQDIFIQLGEAIIHGQTGHIQITRKGFQEGRTRSPEKYLIQDVPALRAQLAAQEGTAAVLGRLNFTGTLNNGKRDLGIIGEGIEPDAEAKMNGIYVRHTEGRPLADTDKLGIVVGHGVAKTLNLRVGDNVTLLISLAEGAINTMEFEVVGVFQTFSKDFDARAVRISLSSAQELMDTESIHLLIMMLDNTSLTDRIAANVETLLKPKGFEISLWRELSDFYSKTIELYDRQFGVMRLIILCMVLLSVANSVNMTLFERTREFGTVLAIGSRPSTVFRQIVGESIFIGACGALLGAIVGILGALVISYIGIPMPPPPNADIGYTAYIRINAFEIAIAALIGWTATILASIVPARRASRIEITEALRHGL